MTEDLDKWLADFREKYPEYKTTLGVGAPMIPPNQPRDNTSDQFGNMKYVNGELNPVYKP